MKNTLAVTVCCISLVGCGLEESQDGFRCDGNQGEKAICYTAHYFGGDAPKTAYCSQVAGAIGRHRQIHLFRGVGISESDVLSVSNGLAAYFLPYDLRFVTDDVAATTSIETLISTTPEALSDLVVRSEDGTDLTGQIRTLFFHNLTEFLTSNRIDGTSNVVVLKRIIDDAGIAFLGSSGTLSGLGISRSLIDQAASDSQIVGLPMQLPDAFAPTLFIGYEDVPSSISYEVISAHEMGHTFGLPHTQVFENLMNPGYQQEEDGRSCLPTLDPNQLATIVANSSQ